MWHRERDAFGVRGMHLRALDERRGGQSSVPGERVQTGKYEPGQLAVALDGCDQLLRVKAPSGKPAQVDRVSHDRDVEFARSVSGMQRHRAREHPQAKPMQSAENPHAGQGMVVLDIGGDMGALVISTPPTMAGVEIEICPAGARDDTPDDGHGWWHGEWRAHHQHLHGQDGYTHAPAWPHVAVLARPTPNGTQYAAIYPGVREGCYDLWTRPVGPTVLSVTARGAEVTTVNWPTDSAAHDG